MFCALSRPAANERRAVARARCRLSWRTKTLWQTARPPFKLAAGLELERQRRSRRPGASLRLHLTRRSSGHPPAGRCLPLNSDVRSHPMHRVGPFSLAAAALVCTVASAQLVEPRTANERALVEAVSKGLSSCFTTLGPKRAFPVAAATPPQSELLAAVLLHASGPHVSDGYNYMLLLHGPSN